MMLVRPFPRCTKLKRNCFICGSEPAREWGATVIRIHRVIVLREQARSHSESLGAAQALPVLEADKDKA
jgi:hypothetical protein